MNNLIVVGVMLLAFAAPAWSATGATGGGGAGITLPSIPARGLRERDALLSLRQEGLRLQAEDGGTLTDAHRAYLQARLDTIRSGKY
jgi:hypothetical protein